MRAGQIEIAVARYFDVRQNMTVPNISWGLGIHECDLLIITKSGFAIECEIKTSKADIVADLKKRHGHNSKKIRSLFFAIPDRLEQYQDLIPERAGIIVVTQHPHGCKCRILRKAKINTEAKKLSDKDILHVAKLGTMRTWKLRETIQRLNRK